jgi:hypothetical protein
VETQVNQIADLIVRAVVREKGISQTVKKLILHAVRARIKNAVKSPVLVI